MALSTAIKCLFTTNECHLHRIDITLLLIIPFSICWMKNLPVIWRDWFNQDFIKKKPNCAKRIIVHSVNKNLQIFANLSLPETHNFCINLSQTNSLYKQICMCIHCHAIQRKYSRKYEPQKIKQIKLCGSCVFELIRRNVCKQNKDRMG